MSRQSICNPTFLPRELPLPLEASLIQGWNKILIARGTALAHTYWCEPTSMAGQEVYIKM